MTAPAIARIGERASWDRVLAALESHSLVTRRRGDSRVEFRCPCHDDNRASGTADYQPGDPGRTLLCCHSTDCPAYRNGAPIAEAIGLAAADLFDGPSPRTGARLPRQRPAPRPPASARPPACRHRYAPDPDYPEHPYVNADGELLARVIRKRCSSCGGKDIRPDRSGWATADRVLYRLPEVLAAVGDGRTVYVVEGEKSADALAALGEVATTCPFGAGKWLPQHTAVLAEARHVVVIADNDQDGYSHAALVAGELAAAEGTELVEVVRGLVDKPKADVVDHLAAGHALADLLPVDPYERLAILGRAAELAEPAGNVAQLEARRGDRRGPPPRDDDDQGDDGGEPDPPAGARPVDGSPGWAWMPPAGDYPGAVLNLSGAGKYRGWSQVVSWAPEVGARLVTEADDGQATGRHFELTVGEDKAIVSNADLRSGDAWDKFPDATGLGAKKVREVMHNIVTGRQPRPLERTLAATRTGWHGRDGERCYLWPDGRTFPDGRPIRLIGMRTELVEAARPRGAATDAELRQALADIASHGRHGGLLGLGAGARSFGQSIRPVPAGLAPWGDPASGKSSLGWHSRSLAITSKGGTRPGWPPLPTRSFSATRTVLELAANAEADMPTLFEDLALPVDAAAIEVREANGKIEALIRSVANGDEIRGRSTRELIPAAANYVRSIPLLTAERMPPVMMASLYRRAVVPRLYPGQVDTAWYAAHSPELLTPLRTLGARVVERLYELGEDAAEALDQYTALALAELSGAIGAESWVTDVPAMAGVVDAAAAILGGLHLVAAVVPGVDPADLTGPVVSYLTVALAEQSDVIADRGAHSGSLADAVSQVLTRALNARRAYVCDKDGRPASLVPGLAPSEQGLREIGGQLAPREYEGQGVPLYWLPDRGGLGIRSESLHGLLTEYREQRAAGLTPRSLPPALSRDGASVPNTTQKGRADVHQVPIGEHKPLLILLRPELLTGDFPARSSYSMREKREKREPAGQAPVNDLYAENDAEKREPAGHASVEPVAAAEPVEAAEPLTRHVPVVPASPAQAGTTPGYVTASERFAAPAVVADVDGGYLARPDRLELLPLPAPLANLAHAVGWALTLKLGVAHAAGMPDDPVLVITPSLAPRLGLPASAPAPGSKAAGHLAALEPLRTAGWQIRDPGKAWFSAWRPGGRTVRIWLPGWDERGACPMWARDDEPGVPAPTLAYRLGLFAEHLGIGWRLNGGATGVDLSASFPRRGGRKIARLAAAELPRPATNPAVETQFSWSRNPMSDERELAWVHCYDGNAAYLAAYGQAVVNYGGFRHVESPAVDLRQPGYWRLSPPEWADRLLPNPLDPTGRDARTGATGPRWYSTPTLAYLAELGYSLEPLEAWLPDAGAQWGRWYEPWYKRVRAARSALTAEASDPDSAAVLDSLRMLWHATHGMLTLESQGGRRDHDHVITAQYRQALLRRLGKVAEAESRYPLAIAVDNVAYASADPDPRSACPGPMALGVGLGEFKVKGTLPMAEARPLLQAGGAGKVIELFDLAEKYLARHSGGAVL